MNEQTTAARPHRALALGVGGAGCRIIRALKNIPSASWLATAVIDTDSSAIENHSADFQLAASSDWNLRDGTGCGGDVIRGERAIARERHKIIEMLRGYDLIVVTAGLGGGTATGGLRSIASVVRSIGVPSVFLLTMPFITENYARRKNAEDCLAELIHLTNVVLPMPNDLLYSRLPPDTPASAAVELADTEMASTLEGIADLLRCRDFTGADYAVFLNALNRRKCTCGVGVGRADASSDRIAIAMKRMLDSPFLGGLEHLKEADAAILILSGGTNLTLAEMKRAMEQCSAFLSKDTEFILGINTHPDDPDFFQISAIAIRYDETDSKSQKKKPAMEKSSTLIESASSGQLVQDELGLISMSRGVFDKYSVVKFHDEDIDVPTFQRRSLFIDKGS